MLPRRASPVWHRCLYSSSYLCNKAPYVWFFSFLFSSCIWDARAGLKGYFSLTLQQTRDMCNQHKPLRAHEHSQWEHMEKRRHFSMHRGTESILLQPAVTHLQQGCTQAWATLVRVWGSLGGDWSLQVYGAGGLKARKQRKHLIKSGWPLCRLCAVRRSS